MSSGPGSSGKPCPRLMALLSRAACDIASKTVTGRSAKTLFMEVMRVSAAGRGRQSRSLPGQHAARKVLVIGKPRGLRGERGRHRPFAGAAGQHHLLAMGIRNFPTFEGRQRHYDGAGIAVYRDLVRLADIDHEVAALGHALRHVLWRQILHLVRHSVPPHYNWSE